jgi:hypothetical protein
VRIHFGKNPPKTIGTLLEKHDFSIANYRYLVTETPGKQHFLYKKGYIYLKKIMLSGNTTDLYLSSETILSVPQSREAIPLTKEITFGNTLHLI